MRCIIKTLFLFAIFINSLISYGQQTTEEGWIIPLKGEIKVLVVWAKVVDAINNPAPVSGFGMGQLPPDANEFFDPSFTPGIEPTAYLTKYFYEQSFGQYIVTGDYLNHVLEVTDSTQGGYNQIFSYLNGLYSLGLLQNNLANNSPLSEFDKYTMNSANRFLNKPNSSDSKIDAVIILWSDHFLYPNGGNAMVNSFNTTIGPFSGVNVSGAFKGFDGLGTKKFIIQEYFHAMYGGNEWHTGAGLSNTGGHTFMTFTNPWEFPVSWRGREYQMLPMAGTGFI